MKEGITSRSIQLREYLYTLILILALLGAGILPNYAPDTYYMLNDISGSIKASFTSNGRWVTAVIYLLSEMIHLDGILLVTVYAVLGMIFLYFSVLLYEDSLRSYIANDLLRCILSALTICNIYIIEYFLFHGKINYMLSVLLCVLAYRGTRKVFLHLSKHPVTDIIMAEICLIISAGSYQGILALYIVLMLPVVLDPRNRVGRELLRLLEVLLLYAGGGLVELLYLHFVSSNRAEAETIGESLTERILGLLRLPYNSIHAFGIIPEFLFPLFTLCIFAVGVYGARKSANSVSLIIHMVVLCIGVDCSAWIMILLGIGWYAPRVIYVFACMPWLLAIYCFQTGIFNGTSSSTEIRKAEPRMIAIMSTVFLIIEAVGFLHIFKEKFETNMLDQYRCDMIQQSIDTYEEETGNTILHLSFYMDQNHDAYNSLFSSYPLFRESAFDEDWSNCAMMNVYENKKYTAGKKDTAIAEAFSRRDWTTFSQEQLVFQDDTLHICVY